MQDTQRSTNLWARYRPLLTQVIVTLVAVALAEGIAAGVLYLLPERPGASGRPIRFQRVSD